MNEETGQIAIIEKIFEADLTKKGLKELRTKYPAKTKYDMSFDAEFKAARKKKTERNKLTKALNDRRISVCTQIKKHGDGLISKVEDIYDSVLIPFEKEDLKRKENAAREEREKQELLVKEGKKIAEIRGFVRDSTGRKSDYIQGSIEAVDLIDVDVFHKDLIHEAITVKKETLAALGLLLTSAIAGEAVEAERLKLEEAKKAMEWSKKMGDKINNLRMIPVEFISKSYAEITAKITQLASFEITEEVFKEYTDSAREAKIDTVSKLQGIAKNAEIMENQAAETKRIEDKKAADLEEANAIARNAQLKEDKTPNEINPAARQGEGFDAGVTAEFEAQNQPVKHYKSKSIYEPTIERNIPLVAGECSLTHEVTEWCTRHSIDGLARKELIALINESFVKINS